jgi:hypothetical protein
LLEQIVGCGDELGLSEVELGGCHFDILGADGALGFELGEQLLFDLGGCWGTLLKHLLSSINRCFSIIITKVAVY